jgi:transposase-like protein
VKTLIQSEVENSLESMLREGARRMLQTALEMEVASYLEVAREDRDEAGGQAVVRNGHHRERTLVSGVGPLTIQQPRVHDRRADHQFTRAILPRYRRRTPSIDALILHSISKAFRPLGFPKP